MTWRIRVQHNTRYRYTDTVKASYNEARMTPLSTPSQTTIDARMEMRPSVRPFRYWDYWGTLVHAFDVHVPHDELTVTASAVVETGVPPLIDGVDWDFLGRDDQLDLWCEFLAASRYVPVDAELVGHAVALQSAADRPIAGALAATAWVNESLTYTTGSTTVATAAPEAFRAGRGVCQDYAHVLLAVLRAMSIPARYASGYLHPDADATVGEQVAGQSHAWVEAWVGDWIALDPTNNGRVGEQHVLVARGRDYADVPPLKGIYTGEPAKRLDVSVELTRLA